MAPAEDSASVKSKSKRRARGLFRGDVSMLMRVFLRTRSICTGVECRMGRIIVRPIVVPLGRGEFQRVDEFHVGTFVDLRRSAGQMIGDKKPARPTGFRG